MTDIIKPFLEWAGKEAYDTAHTYDTERSQWVVFNPMTADLWKAYQAGAAQEREACAQLFPQPHMEYFGREIQDAIRARAKEQTP